MAEENLSEITLDNFNFIFRRPWLILCSFLLIYNAIQAYTATIPALYKADAVLLFESGAGKDAFNEKKAAAEKALASSATYGPILEEVLKEVPDPERKVAYKKLRKTLNSYKTGVQFEWEDRGVGSTLKISFAYDNASQCYMAVKTGMDVVIKASEQKFTNEMEANLIFLNKQLKFYKDKIGAINAESEDIRQKLMERYSELSPREREEVLKFSVSEAYNDKGLKGADIVDDGGALRLRRDLGDFKDKRKRLQASLDDGTFMVQNIVANIDQGDQFLEEYKKVVAAKEMEIYSLLSRGYKEEHPNVKQLREDIDRIKEIRKRRLAGLKSGGPSSSDYEEARQMVALEIKELDMKIALIKDNLKDAEVVSPPKSARQIDKSSTGGSSVKEEIAKLSNLASERSINESDYQEMRRKLASAELKYRTESEAAGFKISVVDEPALPTQPDKVPLRRAALQGFVAALAIAFGIGWVSYKLKDVIHSDRELEDLLGVPVIATVDSIITKAEMVSRNARLRYTAMAMIIIVIVTRVVVALVF